MDFKQKSRFPWLSHFIYSLKHRGLMNTCSMGLKEWQKERELGIRTFGAHAPDELSIEADSKLGGHLYQPSSSIIFQKAIEALDFDVSGKVFLDIGSGKGRALVLAAEAGFGKVIGVEYAAELNDMAHANIETVRPRFPNTVFELHEADALKFNIPDEVDVIYLFNPFDEEATRGLMTKVTEAFDHPKDRYLIYVHPIHCNVMEDYLGKPLKAVCNNKGIPEVVIYAHFSTNGIR
ncbi:MAG: class I SAM-dependent methyltransferase [Bacteroidetes bacterium]|nr:MAG: class I SAM-dependent methyltransferase [Bacteroidota bacterium]